MNTLSYGLLALLTANSLSGYELTQSIKPLWRAGHSQIYPLLVSMEQKGYISYERIEQSDKPDKKYIRSRMQDLNNCGSGLRRRLIPRVAGRTAFQAVQPVARKAGGG